MKAGWKEIRDRIVHSLWDPRHIKHLDFWLNSLYFFKSALCSNSPPCSWLQLGQQIDGWKPIEGLEYPIWHAVWDLGNCRMPPGETPPWTITASPASASAVDKPAPPTPQMESSAQIFLANPTHAPLSLVLCRGSDRIGGNSYLHFCTLALGLYVANLFLYPLSVTYAPYLSALETGETGAGRRRRWRRRRKRKRHTSPSQ